MAGVLIALATTPVLGKAKQEPPDYRGQTAGKPYGRVTLTLDRKRDGRDHGLFVVKRLPLDCEGGTTRRWPYDEIRVGFHGGTQTVDGRRYEDGHPNASEIYFRVHGRLAGDHARGYLIFYLNPYDPNGEYNLPECSSGKLGWKATR